MAYAWSNGKTQKEIASACHFTLPEDRFHAAFNSVDQSVSEQEFLIRAVLFNRRFRSGTKRCGDQAWIFGHTGAKLWIRHCLTDFQRAPGLSEQAINKWVSEKTKGKITDAMPANIATDQTGLVLVDVLYFKSLWDSPFQPNDTKDGSFDLLDGTQITVPMMEQGGEFKYSSGDGWQAVELPYSVDNWSERTVVSMMVVLPEKGRYREIEGKLTPSMLESALQAMNSTEIHLVMPRFSFQDELGLKDSLGKMGMTDVFSQNSADFSAINENAYISDISQKAMVDVYEMGTEAASSTEIALPFSGIGPPGSPVEFKMDRPFILLIRHNPTGTILFIGRVLNPKG